MLWQAGGCSGLNETGVGVSADTCIPDFDRAVPAAGDDLLAALVVAHAHHPAIVSVLLARPELKSGCQTRRERLRIQGQRQIGVVSALTPASHTLIVPPLQADTILVPSWL